VCRLSVMSGKPKALGEPHETQCLAVAFGFGHAVIAAYPFLRVTPFLVTDDHHGAAVDPAGCRR